MAKKSQMTQVGKRKLEISNLDKPLWPEDGIVKAELIEYYLKIAPMILRHIKGRRLSFVRFPDGIYGESFFQKNRPDWAPAWLEHEKVGDEDSEPRLRLRQRRGLDGVDRQSRLHRAAPDPRPPAAFRQAGLHGLRPRPAGTVSIFGRPHREAHVLPLGLQEDDTQISSADADGAAHSGIG